MIGTDRVCFNVAKGSKQLAGETEHEIQEKAFNVVLASRFLLCANRWWHVCIKSIAAFSFFCSKKGT